MGLIEKISYAITTKFYTLFSDERNKVRQKRHKIDEIRNGVKNASGIPKETACAARSRINWLRRTLCMGATAGGLILHFVSSELMRNPFHSNIYTTRDDVDKSSSPMVNFAVARGGSFAREKNVLRARTSGVDKVFICECR